MPYVGMHLEHSVVKRSVEHRLIFFGEGPLERCPPVALCFNVWAEGWQRFAHDMHPPAAGTPRALWLMATRIDKLLMLQLLEFIPIKPSVAMASDAPGSDAVRSKLPSPDRGPPPSGGGWCRERYDNA